jgi:hypothetical protein
LLIAAACVFATGSAARAQNTGRLADATARLHAVLEKTFLDVDVLALDVCLDAEALHRIDQITAARRTKALEDSVTRTVLDAAAVFGTIRFLRNVSYSQFIGGIIEEQQHAVKAGLLADSTYRNVSAALPQWFSFLENRGIRKNERVIYDIRGDTIRSMYIDLAGERLLDRSDVGYWRRTSVLATWLAPGSGFRGDLMRSAWSPPVASDAACASDGDR